MGKYKILLVCVSTLLVLSLVFLLMKITDKKPESKGTDSAVTIEYEENTAPTESENTESTVSTAYVYTAYPKTSAVSSASSSASSVLSVSVSATTSTASTTAVSSKSDSKSSSSKTSDGSSNSQNSSNSSNPSGSSGNGTGSSSGGNPGNSSSGQYGGQSVSSQTVTEIKTTTAPNVIHTETTAAEPEPVVTESPTEEIPPTEEISVIDRVFAESGESRDSLGDCQQLIAVSSYGSGCTVTMYEKNDGVWQDIYSVGGIVGLNGVSAKSGEGDYRTPKGIFTLGFGFGTEDLYNLGIEYRKLNENCYWVDDPQSDYYNLWVESDDTSAWNSAEHLIDYPSAYHYAVVIDYNTELIKGAGSAIFLHCAVGSYTAGCVAVPDDSMYYIINWLDSSKDPKIIIY